VSGKIIVCRCEDVTEKDVAHALELGYADIEEVKRYTGFGTGPCQGKECQAMVACLIAELGGRAASEISPFTARPPLQPTPLRLLAGADDPAAGDDESIP
jgi:bacterioferritin-associated ferredoxin